MGGCYSANKDHHHEDFFLSQVIDPSSSSLGPHKRVLSSCYSDTTDDTTDYEDEKTLPLHQNGLYDFSLTTSPLKLIQTTKNRTNTATIPGLKGLYNIGNTCFMNAALQCMNAASPLTVYFLYYNWERAINTNNPLSSSNNGSLVRAYAKTLEQIWSPTASVICPSELHGEILAACPQFMPYEQQDTQELLAFLLDGLHEDLNRVRTKPFVQDIVGNGTTNDEVVAATAWHGYLLRNKSIIVDLFQGQLKSTIVCQTCGGVSIKFEPFMFLSVPMITSSTDGTLEDCLEAFAREEELEQKVYCRSCDKHRVVTKRMEIWKAPNVFIIHLKRFDASCKKNGRSVKFPIELPMERFVYHQQDSYDLFAVANHHGKSGNSGHYTADVKHGDSWYRMDDQVASRMPAGPKLKDPDAYVLFYAKQPSRTESNSAALRCQSISFPQNWPHSPSATAHILSQQSSTPLVQDYISRHSQSDFQ